MRGPIITSTQTHAKGAAVFRVRDGRVTMPVVHWDRGRAFPALRLAGQAMSQEDVEIVRRLLGPFEQDEIVPLFRDEAIWTSITAASATFFASDFECVFVRDDVGRAAYSGLGGLRAAWLDWLLPWETYHAEIEDVIDAGEGRVLVLTRDYACPKGASGEVSFMGAPVWTVRDGKVARIEFYWNRAEGLAAVGLAG
jgi:ketosteroid isomerase-like protein